jgi:uncharacterized protein
MDGAVPAPEVRMELQPKTIRRMLLACATAIVAFAATLPAAAVTFDQVASALRRDVRVYDFADVLSDADERRLSDRVKAMEQARLAEVAVVIADRLESADPHVFARDLGERWSVGNRETANGLVVLVSIRDRKWSFATGTGLETVLPELAIDRIARRELVPAFRAARYADGLDAALAGIQQHIEAAGGAEAIAEGALRRRGAPAATWLALLLGALTAAVAVFAWPRGSTPGHDPWKPAALLLGFGSLGTAVFAASQAPWMAFSLIMVGLPGGAYALLRLFEGAWVPVPLDDVGDRTAQFAKLYWAGAVALALVSLFVARSWWILAFIVLALPIGLAIRGYFRRVPRQCPECRGALRWLPEAEERQFLHDEENLEQALGSVEYDIWRCQKCNRSAVSSRAQIFSGHSLCPRCGRRTVAQRTVVDEQPTAWADGSMSEITECKNPKCGYHDRRHRTIERRGYHWNGGGGGGGIIILPPLGGGGWGGGGWHGDAGGSGGWGGGIDVGDFGGSGDFGGGGVTGDW